MAVGNRQLSPSSLNVKIPVMMRRWSFLLVMTSLLIIPVRAQADLLARVNGLRQSQGLPAYTLSAALNNAAANHAGWLARTGIFSHSQEDGTGPRTRARNAGYSSNWVSENYYIGGGGSAEPAWIFWLNSPAHYAGLVSPYYNNIGIGSASSGGRTAYVLVFGNPSGRLPESSAASLASGNDAGRAAPAYVLGLDDAGNIMHEVQSGDTIGDIALIYGYTWADIPYMLEINDMAAEDIRLLNPGSVFLVPPKDGTFTPTPATPEATATSAAATSTIESAMTPTPAPVATSPAPTAILLIGDLPRSAPDKTTDSSISVDDSLERWALPGILVAAAIVQAGIIAGASILLMRGRH